MIKRKYFDGAYFWHIGNCPVWAERFRDALSAFMHQVKIKHKNARFKI